MPTTICRQYVSSELREVFFISGIAIAFALSIKSIVSQAGRYVEATACPSSRGFQLKGIIDN